MGCDFETLEEYNDPLLANKWEELVIRRELIGAEIRAISAYYKQLYENAWLGKYVRFTSAVISQSILGGRTEVEKRVMLDRIYLVERSYYQDYNYTKRLVFARLQLMRKDGQPYSEPKRLKNTYSLRVLEILTDEEVKTLCEK